VSRCGSRHPEQPDRACVLPGAEEHADHTDGEQAWPDPIVTARLAHRRQRGTGLRLARQAAAATEPARRSR
jgi:hypothetical protein